VREAMVDDGGALRSSGRWGLLEGWWMAASLIHAQLLVIVPGHQAVATNQVGRRQREAASSVSGQRPRSVVGLASDGIGAQRPRSGCCTVFASLIRCKLRYLDGSPV
jgi:hypothetical protein